MKRYQHDPGFDIFPEQDGMGFEYGPGVFGPRVEKRSLDAIRGSLMDPSCSGPGTVYAIAMDVGKTEHLPLLREMHLLYGAVSYARGRLGREPVRSQGHIHARSAFSGLSTPEVYEIWSGKAVIYMQESGGDDPGRCFAVRACPGDVVIVPPDWVHATVSLSEEGDDPMTFGAWCVRDYSFDYKDVRAHKGIAWFPVYGEDGSLRWQPNPAYRPSRLICKSPGAHPDLGIVEGESIYRTFEKNPEAFAYVANPALKDWKNYVP